MERACAVVNCFQILYIRSLNTIEHDKDKSMLGCELLSDFVYSFFEHNSATLTPARRLVVNCFQILYIRSLNTILTIAEQSVNRCELLSDFVYSFFEHNKLNFGRQSTYVVNCFQILYIRSLNTIGRGSNRMVTLL